MLVVKNARYCNLFAEMESNSLDGSDFVSGDGRVMSQPTLLSLHVLWLREHNRIASRLKDLLQPSLNSFSDQAADQVLFQVGSFESCNTKVFVNEGGSKHRPGPICM